MKYVLATVLAALVIAGCSKEPKAAAEAQMQAEPCIGSASYSPFPNGLVLDMPTHFRSDRIVTKRNGEIRRAVTLEYLTGSEADARQSVDVAMAAAGYAPKASQGEHKLGVIRQAYASEGKKSFWVVISPTAGKHPSNPEAKGTIAISWQLSPAQKQKASQDMLPKPTNNPPAEAGA